VLDTLEVVGIAILIGYLFGKIFNRFKIPAVAGYVLIGIILGQSVLNIFHDDMLKQVGVISDIALSLIAFIIGSELRWSSLKTLSRQVFVIVIFEALGAFALVTFAIQSYYHYWPLSLVLGAIASATAPAATVMVIRELRASGNFTKTLLAIVAIDDAIALIIYGFASALARMMLQHNKFFSIKAIIKTSSMEIFGAILIGLLMGFVIAFIIRRIANKENIYIITLGALFIITGLADQLKISALLANMTFGVFLTNVSPIASKKVFNMIDVLSPPILIAFFVTAGAHLKINLLANIWLLALIYLIARIIGKLSGAYLGGIFSGAEEKVRKYMGFGLLSQVGVAIGLALVVNREFYNLAAEGRNLAIIVVNILLGTTIVTEIIGPLFTKYALLKAGEVKKI
jgi:Kef-type K+ transport system membrane component KefB